MKIFTWKVKKLLDIWIGMYRVTINSKCSKGVIILFTIWRACYFQHFFNFILIFISKVNQAIKQILKFLLKHISYYLHTYEVHRSVDIAAWCCIQRNISQANMEQITSVNMNYQITCSVDIAYHAIAGYIYPSEN